MTVTATTTGTERFGSRQATDNRPISIITLGQALSAFFIVSYTLCILGYLLFPGMPVKHESLAIFLPGFTLLSWHTFFLGLIESFTGAGISPWCSARSTTSFSAARLGGCERCSAPDNGGVLRQGLSASASCSSALSSC